MCRASSTPDAGTVRYDAKPRPDSEDLVNLAATFVLRTASLAGSGPVGQHPRRRHDGGRDALPVHTAALHRAISAMATRDIASCCAQLFRIVQQVRKLLAELLDLRPDHVLAVLLARVLLEVFLVILLGRIELFELA